MYPFDLERALAGEPVVMKKSTRYEIINVIKKTEDSGLLVVVEDTKTEEIHKLHYTIEGKFDSRGKYPDYNLLMKYPSSKDIPKEHSPEGMKIWINLWKNVSSGKIDTVVCYSVEEFEEDMKDANEEYTFIKTVGPYAI